MPARHRSLRTVASLGKKFEERLMSTKEGVGETSGQTAGSFPIKAGPAEETGFLRSVRIRKVVRNFMVRRPDCLKTYEIWS
jgi:hypothetical protein